MRHKVHLHLPELVFVLNRQRVVSLMRSYPSRAARLQLDLILRDEGKRG